MNVGGVLHNKMMNTNSPDFDLERDIMGPDEDEIVLGMAATELSSRPENKKFQINIFTITISALIFLAILAWFDFIQTAFYSWMVPNTTNDLIPASVKLWYALLLTIVIIILVWLIYYHTQDHILLS